MKRILLFPVSLWLILAVVRSPLMADESIKTLSALQQINLLSDVRHEIVGQYVMDPPTEKMADEAAKAMMQSLDDPYSVFIAPDELEGFDKQIRGSFSGIGAEIDNPDGFLRIVTPLEDSPAYKAGILAGDLVLEIDGQSTWQMSSAQASKRLTGQPGTPVTLKIRHLSGEETTLTIVRATINVRTVRGVGRLADQHWDYMLDPVQRIGYIRISQFIAGTGDDVAQAIRELQTQQVRGLILDLRFNPGGLLESGIQVADFFLPAGKRIVSVKGRTVPEHATHSTGSPLLADIPMIVLANQSSASAAEIVTGALADNQRAVFIGTRTFGKGSVQQIRPLESGHGAVKITNAYYYLPSGRNIHKRKDSTAWGVDPTPGQYVDTSFAQLQQMLRIRRQSDILSAPVSTKTGERIYTHVTPDWVTQNLADIQLAAALKAMVGRLDDAEGKWPQVGLDDASAQVKQSQRENLIRQRDSLMQRLDEIQKDLAKLDDPATTQPMRVNAPDGSAASADDEDEE